MYQEIMPIAGNLASDTAAFSSGLSNIIAASATGASIVALAGAGAAIGQGFAAGKAVEAIGRQPEAADTIRGTLILGCVLAETGAIYGLLVALILLFANPFVDMYIDAMRTLGVV